MPDSSNSSELEEPLSSDSLDTMIGISTETGRTTATTLFSSSEDQALSDPTLTSSDSRQPITPRQEGNGRLQNGDPSCVPVELLEMSPTYNNRAEEDFMSLSLFSTSALDSLSTEEAHSKC